LWLVLNHSGDSDAVFGAGKSKQQIFQGRSLCFLITMDLKLKIEILLRLSFSLGL